jgi:hypothetical protein
MANENFKTINTRIALRTGDFAYWTTGAGKDLELFKGEVCVCTVAVADNEATTAPTVLFKVANATGQKFADLNWVSGLAADVYAWAKKETPDWRDFPYLPIELEEKGSGKFVTDIAYASNKFVITYGDVAWGDITGKPNFVNSVKTTDDDIVILAPETAANGDVTITGAHKQYNKAGSTTDASSDATTAGSSVTIKVPTLTVDAYGHTEFNGETSHTITIPSEVAVGDGDITITAGGGLTGGGAFNVNQDDDKTITISHAAVTINPTQATPATAGATNNTRTYVQEVLLDEYGHVAGVKTGTETD